MLLDLPTSNQDIQAFLKANANNVEIIEMKNLYTYPKEELFEKNTFVICFEENKKSNIGHWTCLLYDHNNNVLEYFNSCGTLVSMKKYILKYMKINNINTLITNSHVLQGKKSNTCGKYVALRCIMRDIQLNNFLMIFENKMLKPDELINMLVRINI